MGSGIPQFLVRREPRYQSWKAALAALWSSGQSVSAIHSAQFSRNLFESRAHLPRRGLFASGLLHFAVICFLVRVPLLFLSPQTNPLVVHRNTEPLIYQLRLVDLSKPLPSLAPPGPGGRPGMGFRPELLPARGSTAFHARLTIVSNPPRPDNNRQTIVQLSSPPELRIAAELRLPNVLIGNPLAAPKPRLEVHLQKPARAPVRQQSQAEPNLVVVQSDVMLALAQATNSQPHLPVPPTSAVASARLPNGDSAAAAGFTGGDRMPGESGGILVIGVDPEGVGHLLSLPPGNRYGTFSISPAGGQPGSPGGVPGGAVGGGIGGAGTGGDGSTGIGSGGGGGGGGGSGAGGILSIAGGSGSGGGGNGGSAGGGRLPVSGPASMVFPVVSAPHIRKNSLIVSTGPVGGGGLGVYGALHGGKIYTIFLRMPKKNWTLQYCLLASAPTAPPPATGTAIAQLGEGVVPPDAVERFDFKRLPVSEDKADKMIVLHGVIRADGSVDELKVFQGVQSEMDEAALAAFGQWKFKPALRASEAVAVEVLVGIPARVPKS